MVPRGVSVVVGATGSGGAGAGYQVVHAGVLVQRVDLRQRVVAHAFHRIQLQAGVADGLAEFCRGDELGVVVRALGQQLQQVFRAYYRKQVGLQVAVQRGKEHLAAWFHQRSAGFDDGGGVGYVFQHFHAGDHVVQAGFARGHVFGGDFFIAHLHTGFQAVQVGHLQRLVGQVYAGHLCAFSCHRFRQDAAAAADVDDVLACQRSPGVDPFQPQRVDFV